MALTKELLKANEALSTLTDEQLECIVSFSANHENDVIARKTGELYGQLDNDILSVSGVAKNGAEKTYEYLKRVLNEYKTRTSNVDALNAQIAALNKDKAKLEKTIAEGTNDAEMAKALKQTKADLAKITEEYNSLNTRYAEQEQKHEKELFGIRINSELQAAAKGLNFKASLPQSVTDVVLKQAFEKVTSQNPDYIDDGKGGKVLAFKDSEGAILRNKDNQLNPYTAEEMLRAELDKMGVLDAKREAKGSGTHVNNASDAANQSTIDVSAAKTRNEAFLAIDAALMARGLTAGSEEYQQALNEEWKNNNVSKLPE